LEEAQEHPQALDSNNPLDSNNQLALDKINQLALDRALDLDLINNCSNLSRLLHFLAANNSNPTCMEEPQPV
jgi:hypothetical protein